MHQKVNESLFARRGAGNRLEGKAPAARGEERTIGIPDTVIVRNIEEIIVYCDVRTVNELLELDIRLALGIKVGGISDRAHIMEIILLIFRYGDIYRL